MAEALGKNGEGILPNIEIDSLLLTEDPGDRPIIIYQTQTDLWDERRNFEMSLTYIDNAIPRLNYRIDTVEELAEHFVMSEYAIAMCGYLMQVCPFDQPDVASAKAELDILKNGQPEPDFTEVFTDEVDMGRVEVSFAPMFEGCEDLHETLYALLYSIQPGDFFALNAFLPFTGEGRREAIEQIRNGVAESFGCVSSLEVGPRDLHSTGQLEKRRPEHGRFSFVGSRIEGHSAAGGSCGTQPWRAGEGPGCWRFGDARQARAPLRASAFAGQLRRNAAPARPSSRRCDCRHPDRSGVG